MMHRSKRLAAAAVVTLGIVVSGTAEPATQSGASIIYLVRHAETASEATDPRDPPLSAAGQQRAATLAHMLADAELVTIHSTNLQRTLGTAAPVAEAFGLEVETYDPFDRNAAAALVERLKGTPGGHLIVGHSNTTPAFVEAFGGDPRSPISEDEYDRLYLIAVGPGGDVVSSLLHYAPS